MTDLPDEVPIFPDQPDPVVDRYLVTLSRFTTRPGFENRVMARVWRPAPRLVVVWRDRMRQLATPGRVWTAAGAMAAGSFLWILALGSWLAQSAPSPEVARQWVTSQIAIPAMDALNTAAASWWGTAIQYGNQYVSPGRFAPFVITVLAILVISAIGLIFLMRLPLPEKARSNAAH